MSQSPSENIYLLAQYIPDILPPVMNSWVLEERGRERQRERERERQRERTREIQCVYVRIYTCTYAHKNMSTYPIHKPKEKAP